MKKFLSIKNSQGIYVARASFSTDETVIDFIDKESDSASCSQLNRSDEKSEVETIKSLTDSLTSIDKPKKNRNPVKKVLKILHLKSKSSEKMSDEKSAKDEASTSNDAKDSLAVPKMVRSKGRTAALIKKFSSPKKSAIPTRSGSSGAVLTSTTTQDAEVTTKSTPVLSMSEMNLVNIDYHEANSLSGDDVKVDVKVGRSQYRNLRSGSIPKINTAAMASRSTCSSSSDQLQITITGTKRCRSSGELLERNLKPSAVKATDERQRTLTTTSATTTTATTTKKLSISRGVTVSTITVPPAPTSPAPSLPTYRISNDEIIANASMACKDSTRQSAMSSESSSSAAARDIAAIASKSSTSEKKLLTTDFDCESPTGEQLTPDERRNSLLSELIEAESREPTTISKLPERGRRFPGVAASEQIKFHSPTEKSCEDHGQSTSTSESKALTPVVVPPVVVVVRPPSTEARDDAQTSPKMNVDESKRRDSVTSSTAQPPIQFEVGQKVRPLRTSNPNIFACLASIDRNDDIDDFSTSSASAAVTVANDSIVDTSLISAESFISNCSSLTPSTQQSLDNADKRDKTDCKKNHRRRIAYIPQEPTLENYSNASVVSYADNDHLCSDQYCLDSTLTQLTFLTSTNTEIKEKLMPAYGDLLCTDDGVIKFTEN